MSLVITPEMQNKINNTHISLDEFYSMMKEDPNADWEHVHTRDEIFDFINVKMREGASIKHMIDALHRLPRIKYWDLWLNNVHMTPRPIKSKRDLFVALTNSRPKKAKVEVKVKRPTSEQLPQHTVRHDFLIISSQGERLVSIYRDELQREDNKYVISVSRCFSKDLDNIAERDQILKEPVYINRAKTALEAHASIPEIYFCEQKTEQGGQHD